MPRRNASTPKIHRCPITPASGPLILPPPAASPPPLAASCDYERAHHSITPVLHYSITPLLHYSILSPMPSIPIIMPQLAESIADSSEASLLFQIGHTVP